MVAVIAIIMSIILPTLWRGRDYAHRVLCATNQHNWGAGLRSYANDNRGYFPDNRFATLAEMPARIAAYGPDYRYGLHISWNSSVVQKFWKQYLVENHSTSKTDEHDVLNCPTQKWHQVNDINLAGGLVGYFYMPGRSQDGDTNYSMAGTGWVFKEKFGGQFTAAPIMSDMKQWHPDPTWGWFFGPGYPKAGSPISSHTRRTGEPEGGNFLFEDVHVTWYESDLTGDPNPMEANEIMQLGCTVGGWRQYYKILIPGLP